MTKKKSWKQVLDKEAGKFYTGYESCHKDAPKTRLIEGEEHSTQTLTRTLKSIRRGRSAANV